MRVCTCVHARHELTPRSFFFLNWLQEYILCWLFSLGELSRFFGCRILVLLHASLSPSFLFYRTSINQTLEELHKYWTPSRFKDVNQPLTVALEMIWNRDLTAHCLVVISVDRRRKAFRWFISNFCVKVAYLHWMNQAIYRCTSTTLLVVHHVLSRGIRVFESWWSSYTQ